MKKPEFMEGKDYCTMFPDKVNGVSIKFCCYMHDWEYSDAIISRLAADNDLFRCIWKKGRPVVAVLVWLGVRLFGKKHYKGK